MVINVSVSSTERLAEGREKQVARSSKSAGRLKQWSQRSTQLNLLISTQLKAAILK